MPKVPLLALTATATKISRNVFQRQLNMINVKSIVRSPDRGNIYLTVEKVKDSSCLNPLMEQLRSEKMDTPRTIIYCRSVKDCTDLYQLFDQTLGRHGYMSESFSSKNCLFAMFFHDTLEAKKKVILDDLLNENGHYRVVIATNSLGLGVNLVDCNRIIHYGVPRDLEDYLQEIGRAGRSGGEALAQLYFKGIHLLQCNDEIKNFVKNTTECRRKIILDSFSPSVTPVTAHQERCCDICSGIPVSTLQPTEEKVAVREVSDDQRDLFVEVLNELKTKVGNKEYAFGVPVFSPALIDSAVEHVAYINSIDYIASNLPVMDAQLAIEVFRALCEAFEEEFDYDTHIEETGVLEDNYLESLLANVDFNEELSEEEFVCANDENCDIDSD